MLDKNVNIDWSVSVDAITDVSPVAHTYLAVACEPHHKGNRPAGIHFHAAKAEMRHHRTKTAHLQGDPRAGVRAHDQPLREFPYPTTAGGWYARANRGISSKDEGPYLGIDM